MELTKYFQYGEVKLEKKHDREIMMPFRLELKASLREQALYHSERFKQFVVCRDGAVMEVGNLHNLKRNYPELISVWESITYKAVMGI